MGVGARAAMTARSEELAELIWYIAATIEATNRRPGT
jgi:hypothetical protein